MGIQILDEKSIVIRPTPNRVGVALGSIWLAGWMTGGAIVFPSVIGKTMDATTRWFLMGAALAWLFFTGAVLFALLWQLTGSETIRVVGPDLRIETRFFFVSRVRSLPLDSIHDMNVHHQQTSSKGRIFTHRFIVLHGTHGTLKLRTELEPGEGQRVVDFLRKAVT